MVNFLSKIGTLETDVERALRLVQDHEIIPGGGFIEMFEFAARTKFES